MRKRILVIGGSYFFGRWFVEFARVNHNLTILNRGNIPINLPEVKEIAADRHDEEALMKLSGMSFDICVDFCAYNPGDIERIVNVPGLSIGRYIFISTVDVYKRVPEVTLSDDAEFTDVFPDGPEGDYIKGKVLLENELKKVSMEKDIKYTSVRPAILYGPANYAPREAVFFEYIKNYGEVPYPKDATGFFQLTFVGDGAKILVKICEMEDPPKSINLCPVRIDNYRSFLDALRSIPDISFTEKEMTVSEMLNQNIILPFPLLKNDSQAYKGLDYEAFGVVETDLGLGLQKAYKVF